MAAHTFTVYKTESCPYCHQALRFLGALASARPDIRVEKVDANVEPGRFRLVSRAVGRSTVPQIFLDGRYIGGWTELAQAAQGGNLDAFLDGRETPAPATPATPAKRRRWPWG